MPNVTEKRNEMGYQQSVTFGTFLKNECAKRRFSMHHVNVLLEI